GVGTLQRMAAIASAKRRRPVDVVVTGGDHALVSRLRRLEASPGPSFGWSVLTEDGMIVSESPGPGGQSLAAAAEQGTAKMVGEAQWRTLLQRAQAATERTRRSGAEMNAFRRAMASRKPVATYVLMATIGVVFAIQQRFGNDATPGLGRLGALVRERVFEGEAYRLLSCSLLHGGFVHAAVNTYVLFVLGAFFERVTGSARVVTLFVLSALGGSLASATISEGGMSVGASGAVWGLLGAHAVLAFVRHDLLPEALVAGARRAAVFNLGINVLASFHPLIDMWAHFGGGAAGAVVFALWLHRGLPRRGEGEALKAGPVKAPGLRVVAAMLYATLVGCFAAAVALGKPWELNEAPTLTALELPELSLAVDVPEGLAGKGTVRDRPQGSPNRHWTSGEPDRDALFVEVISAPEQTAAADRGAVFAQALETRDVPEGFEFRGNESIELLHGPAVLRRYGTGPMEVEEVITFVDDREVAVVAYRVLVFPEAAPRGIAARIAGTARPLR
ncbi:MAG: rhomboid family intramembrane serine protease, partial [Myxococcota bacterium]